MCKSAVVTSTLIEKTCLAISSKGSGYFLLLSIHLHLMITIYYNELYLPAIFACSLDNCQIVAKLILKAHLY